MIMRCIILLFIVLSFSSFYLAKCLSQSLVPAMYVLGDSLVDNGNNNYLDVLFFARADYKPYGIDFTDSVPTGRVTNGKHVPDYFADYLGLPSPPPVKQPDLPASLTGYNYASAGCGILPESGTPNCLHLTEQVRLFNVTKETVLRPAFENEAQLDYHLANSIFFIWMGNNDYLLNYFSPLTNTSNEYTPEQFADLLVQNLKIKIQLLHSLGARKMMVFEAPPFGCLPTYYAQNGACDETKNDIALQYNAKLEAMVFGLYSEIHDAYLSIGNAYELSYDAMINPSNYGLTDVTSPCCEKLVIPGLPIVQCKPDGTTCDNRDEYLFWDAAHPSEAAYKIIGGKCITDSTVCFPFTIEGLAEAVIIPRPKLSAA